MSTIIHLERRVTHRYVGEYQHLDEWQDVGRAKVFPPRKIEDGNGHDDAGTYLMHAKIPAGQDPEASRQALADRYTRWGCSHEYDCCGCLSTSAKVKRLTPRTFSVLIRQSRNY
jgi:hypothetical protein